jgi:hypothetical protein
MRDLVWLAVVAADDAVRAARKARDVWRPDVLDGAPVIGWTGSGERVQGEATNRDDALLDVWVREAKRMVTVGAWMRVAEVAKW